MEQYENKNNSTHQTPVNSTHGYSTNPLHAPKYPPAPPPPPPPLPSKNNALPLPPGRNPLRRSSSMRRSSERRHSSSIYVHMISMNLTTM